MCGAPRAAEASAAADAEALKRGASLEEVSRLHDGETLREKREALRQRRICTSDIASLAQRAARQQENR